MHLYNLTIHKGGSISRAVTGKFTNGKRHEILVARGKLLELYSINDEKGKLELICSVEVFGVIRNISPFRVTGTKKDYLVLLSDSGKLMIFEFNVQTCEFEQVQAEPFGKSGCRRISPGEFIALEPMGRAFMIGAIEKQKFVYILNRDSAGRLTISSPNEAHKQHTIVFGMCGVDVKYDNPQFAVLEADYGDPDDPKSGVASGKVRKFLTIYEMDMGLNHVVRKFSDEVSDASAHGLVSLPSPGEGPGGVLILCEDCVIHKQLELASKRREVVCQLPRRWTEEPTAEEPGATRSKLLVSAWGLLKRKPEPFFLIQSEIGDLFKVSFKFSGTSVDEIQISYFDTIPPALSLCIMQQGYLFAAAEAGPHALYFFTGVGSESETVSSSKNPVAENMFFPRLNKNLEEVDSIDSMACITDIKVANLAGKSNGEETGDFYENDPQIYALCSAGPRSTLRQLKFGLGVNQLAKTEAGIKGLGCWSIRRSFDSRLHKYVVVSLAKNTMVLSVEGNNVAEVPNSGLDTARNSLHIGLLADMSIIQVYSEGIRRVKSKDDVSIWDRGEGKLKITRATSNERQVVIALEEGEIIYFEFESGLSGGGEGLGEVAKELVGGDIAALAIGKIPKNRQRSKFLVVGLIDRCILFSLDPGSCLQKLAHQSLPSPCSSVAILDFSIGRPESISRRPEEMEEEKSEDPEEAELLLHVGLINGVLLRTAVDPITGALTDTRSRLVGNKPVRLSMFTIGGTTALLAMSSKTWACYYFGGKYFSVPLYHEPLDCATALTTEICPEGLFGFREKTLFILSVESPGEVFTQLKVPLRYAPKKMAIIPPSPGEPGRQLLVVLESEHRCYGLVEYTRIRDARYRGTPVLPDDKVGRIQAPAGTWATCLRIFDPAKRETVEVLEIGNNEHITCMEVVKFSDFDQDLFLVAGVVRDYKMVPRSFSEAYIQTFVFLGNNTKLQAIHRTKMEDIPMALEPFRGVLLAGVGKFLRMYNMGRQKILKKCEYKHFPMLVSGILTAGERIFVSDVSDSFHVLKHRATENQFFEFVDDVVPRWVTHGALLDYSTLCLADKFENLAVVRIPQNADENFTDDPTTYRLKWESGFLNGASYKFDQVAHFYLGEVATSLCRAAISSSSAEVILYATANGSIGVMYPFETKEDIEFFSHLEMYLRNEKPPLSGRDHSAFRSFYAPVKGVIDGDFCEEFGKLSFGTQRSLAEDLDRTPSEVLKKLEEVKNKIF